MPTYDEAVRIILDHVGVMDEEEKPISASLGQVLATDIVSDIDLPLVDQAGPDGYAVKSSDIQNASREHPVSLKIIGAVRAGIMPRKTVMTGTTMRIMTGSIMPKGADCVVWFEDTDEPGNKNGPNLANPSVVRIHKAVNAGDNILKVGATVKKGALLATKGSIFGTAQMVALALTGCNLVKTFRRPVIGVISTGDELISIGSKLRPNKVINCNGPALASLISHYGGIPRMLGMARDNEFSLLGKIKKGLDCDAIITSGGASRGDYDLTRRVLSSVGELVFSRINMGPGASVAFGMVYRNPKGESHNSIPLFALAGPPEGCMINAETLVRPALKKMLGIQSQYPLGITAIALDDSAVRRDNAFVRWSNLEADGRAVLKLKEEVGALVAVARANCLSITPAGEEVQSGDKIRVLPLDWNTRPY